MGRPRKNASTQPKDNATTSVRKSPRKRAAQSHSPTSIDQNQKRGRPKRHSLTGTNKEDIELDDDMGDAEEVKFESRNEVKRNHDGDDKYSNNRALQLANVNRGSIKCNAGDDNRSKESKDSNEKRLISAAWTSSSNGEPIVTEEEIMALTSSKKLVNLINRLIGAKDVAFQRHKELSQQRIASLEREVTYLQDQLITKQNTIDNISSHLSSLASETKGSTHDLMTPKRGATIMYESPIRSNKESSALITSSEIEDELRTINFSLDMLELLTGARVVNYSENNDTYYFDIKQTDTSKEITDTSVSIDYKLVISKTVVAAAEVTYQPLFMKELNNEPADEAQRLKKKQTELVKSNLPPYLLENLKFPFNTLLQFSAKITKALNKSGRSL